MGVSGCDTQNGSAATVVVIILPQLLNTVSASPLYVSVPRSDTSFMIFWQRWDVPAEREEKTAWDMEGQAQVARRNS